jgi:tetratricopeptide (TPR) repeat protein
MLFDLRGKRKRVVQVVYAALAILFAVSFVGFGIGSDAAGGIFDALGLGSGSDSPETEFDSQIEAAEEELAANPKDERALADLAALKAQAGQSQLDADEQGFPILTEDARGFFEEAIGHWEDYLELDPKQPDGGVASQMITIYTLVLQSSSDPSEIEELLPSAVETAEIAAEELPSANAYATLAQLAYYAGDQKTAADAAERAVEEAPEPQRQQVEKLMADFERQGEQFRKQLAEQQKATAPSPEEAFQNPFEEGASGGFGGTAPAAP